MKTNYGGKCIGQKNHMKEHERKYAFKIGDRVRTTFLCRPFQREYDTRWTGEIFKITRRFTNCFVLRNLIRLNSLS